jgi:hypothetical protein
MLPFPCFRVGARFDGGMSGGPVMNDRGRLCGIVCSNMPPSDEGGMHDSFVSTLSPVLGVAIDAPWNAARDRASYPLIEYATARIIDVNLDRVSKPQTRASPMRRSMQIRPNPMRQSQHCARWDLRLNSKRVLWRQRIARDLFT